MDCDGELRREVVKPDPDEHEAPWESLWWDSEWLKTSSSGAKAGLWEWAERCNPLSCWEPAEQVWMEEMHMQVGFPHLGT